MDIRDMRANFEATDLFSRSQWVEKMKDGSLVNMLDSVTKLFVKFGAMKDPLPASKYSDFSIFSSTYKT